MADEKLKIIKKASDLEKVARGDAVMFNLTMHGASVPVYGIISYKGEKSVALNQRVKNLNPEFGEVAWHLYGFSKLGSRIISKDYGFRYPFRVGSEEYENYKSILTTLRDSFNSLRQNL